MTFNPRLFVFLTLAFMVCTVIGTLSHEGGHYLVGKALGFKPTFHYGSVNPRAAGDLESLWALRTELSEDEFREQWLHAIARHQRHRFMFTLGGPLQTMLTGTIGLILILIFSRHYRNKDRLGLWLWAPIFLSLFWLRQSFNLASGAIYLLKNGYRSGRDDESKLSFYFGLPQSSILIVTGIIGLLVLAFIVLKYVPERNRATFIAAGLAGGGLGFPIWFFWLGPILLP